MKLLGCKGMHCNHPWSAGEGFSYEVPSRAKGNQLYVQELDRIVLKDSKSHRPFASTATCRKAVITTRILQLVHELCSKRIHVTKRDLFYTDVKLFEVRQPVLGALRRELTNDRLDAAALHCRAHHCCCGTAHLGWLCGRHMLYCQGLHAVQFTWCRLAFLGS